MQATQEPPKPAFASGQGFFLFFARSAKKKNRGDWILLRGSTGSPLAAPSA
jgi:hypothetical protein